MIFWDFLFIKFLNFFKIILYYICKLYINNDKIHKNYG